LSVAVALPVAAGSVEAPHPTVTSAGQVIAGGVASTTVMVCSHVLALPQLSVAVQIRVMTKLPAQPPACTESLKVMLATPLQASIAVALPVATGSVEASQATVTLVGHVITGGVVSTAAIVCGPLMLFPQASVAVQVRVITLVLPQPGALVSAWLIVTSPQVSNPVAVPVVAGLVSPLHSTVAASGKVRLGAVVSTTVIVWAPLVLFPQASVADQVRVITLVLPHPWALVSA
jgi:hypothetical protein